VILVQHDHVIEQVPANGPGEPLHRLVLPRTLECRALRTETETLDHGNRWAEDRIIVVDQKPMGRCVGEGLAKSLAHPTRGWTRGDVEEENSPSPMIEREPDIEKVEAHGGYHEEVHRGDYVSVIPKEGAPALLRLRNWSHSWQAARACGKAHVDPNL